MSSSKPKHKKRPWVASSFDDDFIVPSQSAIADIAAEEHAGEIDDFEDCYSSIDGASKCGKVSKKNRKVGINNRASSGDAQSKPAKFTKKLWCDDVLTKDDLAVHKKKVEEVEEWLLKACTGVQGHRLLLLTGPAGCGKTACVRALVAEMGLQIKEWINATSTSYSTNDWNAVNPWVPGDCVAEQGQAAQFKEFVTRVNKYGTVAMVATSGAPVSTSSLLLVEDIPNSFYRDPTQFHDVMRRYAMSGCSPAVFILSDSPQKEHSAKHLFPPHLHQTMALTTIQFNPVATTLLTKALLALGARHGVTAPPDLIGGLAASAGGDIRTAVNALQFSLNASEPPTRPSKAKRRPRGSKAPPTAAGDTLAAVGGKDTSLLMFRALGKALYCKRSTDPPLPLPRHLKHEERAPALETAEAVLERSCLTPATFMAFLHQNYMPFMGGVDSALTALTYFTDADIILGEWTERDVLSVYCSAAVRGLMHATGGPGTKKSTFRALVAPAFSDVSRTAATRRESLRNCYQGSDMDDLTTLTVPYAAKIQRNVYTPVSHILREVGLFGANDGTAPPPMRPPHRPPAPGEVQQEVLLDYDVDIEDIPD